MTGEPVNGDGRPRREHDPDDPRLAWPSGRFVDETLDAGDEPVAPADERELQFVVGQRLVHGMLRALDQDAESRERRVDAILDRVHGTPRAADADERPVLSLRRGVGRALTVAAALAAALVVVVVLVGRDQLPRAEALVSSVGERLGEAVDRRFAIRFETQSADADNEQVWSGELIARGGGQFAFHAQNLRAMKGWRELHVGCDGDELWFKRGFIRFAKPLAEAKCLQERMGVLLDVGHLRLDDLVARLPESCRLITTARLPGLEPGEPGLLRVEGRGLPENEKGRMDRVVLLVDEHTRMVHELSTSFSGPRGQVRLSVTYLHDLEPDGERYLNPY